MALARTDNAPLFADAAASTVRLIAYLAIGIVLMVLDHRGGYLETLRDFSSHVVEPIYRMAALPAEVARDTKVALTAHSKLAEENARLREQLLLAEARNTRVAVLAAQNARLRELLEVQQNLGLSVQMAKLIDIDLDPFRHRIVIDAGRTQGIELGQPVIDARGVVGQIVEVLANTSVAMLITDPNHALPVMVERTGLRTIAVGTGSVDRLSLPNVPVSADIKVGDKLVTSGLGGRFPGGFPVGEIRDVHSDPTGMFAAAVAFPAAALDKSGEVLLLHDLPAPYGPPAIAPDAGPPREAVPAASSTKKAPAP